MPSRSTPYALRLVLPVALLLLAHGAAGGASAAGRRVPAPGEYQVKAAFVYNFIKFVEWPATGQPSVDALRICVLGDVAVAAPFQELNGQEVIGRRLSLSFIRSPQEGRACQVLFVAASQSAQVEDVRAALRNAPVLTIGDTEGYAKRGIMINLFLEEKRVRFEINAEAAREAGLRISTKLLKLARSVHGAAPGGE